MELPAELKKLHDRIEEIKKLYDISEAEMTCLTQMSLLLKMLGYSPQLRLKLMRALTAIDEVIVDELKLTKDV